MNKITKKTVLGTSTGIAAAALLAIGFAAPATASSGGYTSNDHTSKSNSWTEKTQDTRTSFSGELNHLLRNGDVSGAIGDISNSSPVVVAPEIGNGDISVGDVANGDILSGNAVGSGNDITAPVLSGNDTAVGSGNDTSIGNGSGNGNHIGGDTSVGTHVDSLVDSVKVNDIVDSVNVKDIVDNTVNVDSILEDIDLKSILGR